MKQTDEKQYIEMLQNILDNGSYRRPKDKDGNYTEVGRYEIFSNTMRFDLTNNKIPLFTTKKVQYRSAFIEMLWFLTGEQHIKYLQKNNVKIWDSWANENGEVGPLYGFQWRHWKDDFNKNKFIKKHLVELKNEINNTTINKDKIKKIITDIENIDIEIDQMSNVMKTLRDRPEARSHMVTAWRPDHLNAMSIKPCHIMLQFYRYENEISLVMFQRSCDSYLGVPFNIAQYSLLTHMVAHQLDCKAKEFIWHGADIHIYEDQIEQVKQQLKNPILKTPTLSFNRKPDSLFDYVFEDFMIHNYESAKFIKAPLSLQGTPGQCDII